MNTSQSSIQIRTIRVIFGAIVAGQVVFSVIAYALHASDAVPHTLGGETIPVIIACAAAGGAVIAGKALHAIRIRAIGDGETLPERLRTYLATTIIFLAMLEAATIILIVTYLLNGNTVLLFLVAGVLAVAAMHYPSKERIEKDIRMSIE